MNELTVLDGLPLKTFNKAGLAQIERGLVEHHRVCEFFGRSESQHTIKLMTLEMASGSPMRAIHQCTAQIQKKWLALKETGFRLRLARLKANHLREKALKEEDAYKAAKWTIKAEEKEHGIDASLIYIEGLLKDVANLIDAQEQIRKTHKIRDDWDEKDFEESEIEHHIRSMFKLCYDEYMQWGHLTAAGCSYARQFGLHPQVALAEVKHHHDVVVKGLADPTIAPPHTGDFNMWLTCLYEKYKEHFRYARDALGIVDLLTEYSLRTTEPNEET